MSSFLALLLMFFLVSCAHLITAPEVVLTRVSDISDVRAASGVIVHENHLYVVSDDEPDLFYKNVSEASWRMAPGLKIDLDRAPDRKAMKPDFESVFLLSKEEWPPHGAVVAWPSGSGPKRMQAAIFLLSEKSEPRFLKAVSILQLADRMKKHTQDLNIEGALLYESRLFLFQRGNASGSPNQIFSLPRAQFVAGLKRSFWRPEETEALQVQAVDLGRLENVPLTFADAARSSLGLYVLGSAENTPNSYADGEILGTVLFELLEEEGVYKAVRLGRISPHGKYEGVAFDQKTDSLFLVDDADSREKKSGLFQVSPSMIRSQ